MPNYTERRVDLRYALQLELDLYAIRNRKRIWLGNGQTIDWSRKSILIRCGRHLATGKEVQMEVRWSPGVQLVVLGKIMRSEQRGIIVRMLRRRFRGRPRLEAGAGAIAALL